MMMVYKNVRWNEDLLSNLVRLVGHETNRGSSDGLEGSAESDLGSGTNNVSEHSCYERVQKEGTRK